MLLGIIYQTYLQILLNFKHKVISKEQFAELEGKLFAPSVSQQMSMVEKGLFKLARSYHLMPLRVPGINMVLYRAITG